MFEFGFEFEFQLDFELVDFELDLELEPKFKLNSSEPSLSGMVRTPTTVCDIRAYPISQQPLTENNGVVSQRIRGENRDEKI